MGCFSSKSIAAIVSPLTESVHEPLDQPTDAMAALPECQSKTISRPESPDVVGELPTSERSTWHISDGISSQSSLKSESLIQAGRNKRPSGERSYSRRSHTSRSTVLGRTRTSRSTILSSSNTSRSTVLSVTLVEHETLVPFHQEDSRASSLSPPALQAESSFQSSCHSTKYGRHPLTKASEYGDEDEVLSLLSGGYENLDERDLSDQTSLMLAADGCHERIVQALVLAGADVNAVDRAGRSPLMRSSTSGNGRITRTLIDAGADLNQRDRAGMTPLAKACYKGHVNVVQALIDARADVDPSDETGSTPLIRASSIGNELLVEALIKGGANVNAKDNVSMNQTASHCDPFLTLVCSLSGGLHATHWSQLQWL